MALGAFKFYRIAKRAIDLLGATVGLIVFAPLFAVIAVIVRVKMGRPVLYAADRPGLRAEPFRMYKFRTMTEGRDGDERLLPDEQRLTRFGGWLRSSSLDELPELWSVLKGDMSLVGPRPLLMRYLDRYTMTQTRRHEVKPGLTGWAQVNGRNALSWEDKFRYDVWYVDNASMRLDFKILGRTLLGVVRGDGIRFQGHATMPEFMGEDLDDG